VNTKKTEYLFETGITHYAVIKNNIIFIDYNTNTVYKTDLRGNRTDLITVPVFVGGLFAPGTGDDIYVLSHAGPGGQSGGEMYKLDITTGKSEKLFELAGQANMLNIVNIGGYLYYLMRDPDPAYLFTNVFGEDIFNVFGGKIHRLNLSTGEYSVYYESPDPKRIINYLAAAGKYIAAYDMIAENRSERIVIDTVSGEIIRG
jgi:outer membrane protein assembly factor BamB